MKAKNSYLKRFFISYAILLLPSFFLFSFFASNIFSMLREEVRTSLQTELDHFVGKFDLQFQSFELMGLRLSLDSEMATNKLDYTRSSSIRSIQKLNEVKLYDAMLQDVFLTFDALNIYASAGLSSYDTFMYRNLRLPDQDSGRMFRAIMADMEHKGIYYLRSIDHTGYLLYHYPVSLERSYNFASINFLVEATTIGRMLDGMTRGYDTRIGLQLPSGDTLVFRESERHGYSVTRVPSFAGSLTQYDAYTVLSADSEKSQATFHIAARTSLMYAQIIRLEVGSYLLLAALLLAALALSYRFSKRNADPIRQLAKVFSGRQTGETASDSADGQDEIGFIRQMINITIAENTKMNQLMQSSRTLLGQQTMLLLFHGVLNNRSVAAKMMELSSLELDESHFAVMLVAAGSEMRGDPDRVDACYERLWPLPECEMGCSDLVDDQKVMLLLIGLPNEDSSRLQRLAIGRRLAESGSAGKCDPVSICCSRVYDDLEQVNQAYIEAVYVLKTTLTKEKPEPVTLFDDLLTFDLPIVTLSRKETDAFENAVKSLDRAKIETRFTGLMQLVEKEEGSSQAQLALHYRVLNLLLHCVMDLGIEQEILSDVLSVNPAQDETFRQQMSQIFDKICRQGNTPVEGVFNDILRDLQTHFADVNLSLEQVARRANLSKAYVSRLFKLKTGKRYIDYLTEMRMKETMWLLTNTRLNIRDITQKVGYYDVVSFQKKFKALYGLSPAKYRELYGVAQAKTASTLTQDKTR